MLQRKGLIFLTLRLVEAMLTGPEEQQREGTKPFQSSFSCHSLCCLLVSPCPLLFQLKVCVDELERKSSLHVSPTRTISVTNAAQNTFGWLYRRLQTRRGIYFILIGCYGKESAHKHTDVCFYHTHTHTHSNPLIMSLMRPFLSSFQGCTTVSPVPHQEPVSSPLLATSSSAPASSTQCASPAVTRRCVMGHARRNGHNHRPPSP